MTAPAGIARFMVHTVTVERFTGTTAYGDGYAAPTQVLGFYVDRTIYSGGQVIASGRFAFPATVPYIAVQSKITLPAKFGARVVRVVASDVADTNGQTGPDHQTVGVL